MATIKTVNVTTGKVLHYTIKKDGFKPVTGSKLITGNETININMVSTESSDGAYVFGDRIGGVATFVGYFDSVDPNSQATQKYAYFVLDAQHRSVTVFAPSNFETPLPNYNSSTLAYNAKESATWNTNTVLDNFNNVYAFNNARNPNGQSLIVTVDGVPYSPQLPNTYELKQIWENRVALDANDPTLSEYQDKSLTNWGGWAWTSNENTSSHQWCVSNLGEVGFPSSFRPYFDASVYPIFEIPVN